MTTVATPVVPAATDELLSHDDWSREELLAYQRDQLRSVLEHAVSASSYYRETLGSDALAEDVRLDELPILTKQTLMEQFDRVAADPGLRLAAVEAHVGGPDPGGLLAGRFHVFSTSGTTGRRGLFPETTAELDLWLAAGWRLRARIGLGRDARVIGIGAPTPVHITQKLFAGFGGFGGGRPALSVTTPLREIVSALNLDQPEGIVTVPTMAGMLSEEQLEGRLAIGPRIVIVGGEVLSEDVVRRVDAAWGIEPYQVYSSTEALFMASDTPEHTGLQISEDLVVLEVVDEEDRPVAPGVPGFRVLITSLVNRALPLIRYEIADTVTLAGPDPSGQPYELIERVDGRNDDVLRLAKAGGGEALVLPYRLRSAFTHLPDVVQYQVVHESGQMRVRIVLREGASSETTRRVETGVRRAIEDAGAVPPPIAVEPVAEIEREPGTMKVKVIKTVREAAA